MRAVETLEAFARTQGIPDETVFGLSLALEECASNVVNHALMRDPARTFQVAFGRDGSDFHIELRDPGPEFDPTASGARRLQAEDSDPCGGWGIELVRRYINDIQYKREAGENCLRLTKRLAQQPQAAEISNPKPNHP
jgi:anti-sigma regulatory factor (Ser/Thr protein kinase)